MYIERKKEFYSVKFTIVFHLKKEKEKKPNPLKKDQFSSFSN